MACQLIIVYQDCSEDELLITSDFNFLDLVDIKTNNSNETKIQFVTDAFRRVTHDSNQDEIKNFLNINFVDFTAFLLSKKEINFEGKIIESLIFSYILETEKTLTSKLRSLPS